MSATSLDRIQVELDRLAALEPPPPVVPYIRCPRAVAVWQWARSRGVEHPAIDHLERCLHDPDEHGDESDALVQVWHHLRIARYVAPDGACDAPRAEREAPGFVDPLSLPILAAAPQLEQEAA